ncbi:hypothetical protein SAMN05660690_3613 [Geodermatophilus telluris]|uniref:Uncharacterized protein n=1 Tax=Geodermatophilus telluris TaxID=1190417 RepID=A0A1G6SHG5_9ACTN|nr:hypothetical protein [Geodermatophilus telluris]SDD16233.1 hypothetical protein SAMN05660690_3613 [Geodermatophilus telluris]
MTLPTSSVRPPSPWPGSRHETEHRWQLEGVRTLGDAVAGLRALAAELRAAHAAGWSLAQPMRDGHLLATRPSRRERSRGVEPPTAPAVPPSLSRWRVRVVDEPPLPGDRVLSVDDVPGTPVVTAAGGVLRQVGGPPLPPGVLDELARQVSPQELGRRRWAVVPARVGPARDLVADGGALSVHAVVDGALVRTVEVLGLRHAADRSTGLPAAAAAYERLAHAAEAMAAVGGRLAEVDDGLLHVRYDR